MTAERRERAIEAAARADWEDGPPVGWSGWEALDADHRADLRACMTAAVDAVLALGCDCADRLDAEAERLACGQRLEAA